MNEQSTQQSKRPKLLRNRYDRNENRGENRADGRGESRGEGRGALPSQGSHGVARKTLPIDAEKARLK